MALPGLFLLDRSKYVYFVCCGRLHVKLALLFSLTVLILVDIVQTLITISSVTDASDLSTDSNTLLATIYEAIEFLVYLTALVALVTERASWLGPFIVFLLSHVIGLSLFSILAFFALLIGRQDPFDKFLGESESTGNFYHRLIKIIETALLALVYLWLLHVACLAYRYFQDRANEKRTQNSLPTQFQTSGSNGAQNASHSGGAVPAVVTTTATAAAVSAGAVSFSNPNFTEDNSRRDSIDEEDEDEVFGGRGSVPASAFTLD